MVDVYLDRCTNDKSSLDLVCHTNENGIWILDENKNEDGDEISIKLTPLEAIKLHAALTQAISEAKSLLLNAFDEHEKMETKSLRKNNTQSFN